MGVFPSGDLLKHVTSKWPNSSPIPHLRLATVQTDACVAWRLAISTPSIRSPSVRTGKTMRSLNWRSTRDDASCCHPRFSASISDVRNFPLLPTPLRKPPPQRDMVCLRHLPDGPPTLLRCQDASGEPCGDSHPTHPVRGQTGPHCTPKSHPSQHQGHCAGGPCCGFTLTFRDVQYLAQIPTTLHHGSLRTF